MGRDGYGHLCFIIHRRNRIEMFFNKKKVNKLEPKQQVTTFTPPPKEKEDERLPIVIGKTYIFDILGESNMSQDTCAVTIIKRGVTNKEYWTVLSVNSGDIFEAPEYLLTPFESYEDFAPIIRCQYGTTDFYDIDVKLMDSVVDLFQTQYEAMRDEDELKSETQNILHHAIALRDKIAKYSDISNYRYNLFKISNIEENIAKQFAEKSPNSEVSKYVIHNRFYKDLSEEHDSKNIPGTTATHPDKCIEIYIPGFTPDIATDIERFMRKATIGFDLYYEKRLDLDQLLNGIWEMMKHILPKDVLEIEEGSPLSSENLKDFIGNIVRRMYSLVQEKYVVLIMGITKEEYHKILYIAKPGLKNDMSEFLNKCYDMDSDTFENKLLMIAIPIRD